MKAFFNPILMPKLCLGQVGVGDADCSKAKRRAELLNVGGELRVVVSYAHGE